MFQVTKSISPKARTPFATAPPVIPWRCRAGCLAAGLCTWPKRSPEPLGAGGLFGFLDSNQKGYIQSDEHWMNIGFL